MFSLRKIQRFKTLATKTKVKLYKTLVRPIIEYPPIPSHTTSKTRQKQLAKVQNAGLRFIEGHRFRLHGPFNNEQSHIRNQIQAINLRLQDRAGKIWDKIHLRTPHIIENLDQLRQYHLRENKRFPTSRDKLDRFNEGIY